jgi:hypothetical protein
MIVPWTARQGILFDLPVRFDLNTIAHLCINALKDAKTLRLAFDGSRLAILGGRKIIRVNGVG